MMKVLKKLQLEFTGSQMASIDASLVSCPATVFDIKEKYEGRVAQVVEFLKSSESPSARRRSHRDRGVCMAASLQT
ncbi:hypothetical protein IV203_028604 [Nitzschia inconspicua]|uniref:Uncharacterized protein n=1 Tax=Nitzschia inconspicua TaxID=303405 RepID=A0A9K3LQ89_9STRA|nr:hypothetical protein IV203_004746 [Nitzschia inconspicua]KAG7365934.1 hypothetical protein IV203_028604 [Nitzschia inconspicua]